MNWLQEILNDTGLTRYRLSQLTGISEAQLLKIIKNDVKMENVKYGQVVKILDILAMKDIEEEISTTNKKLNLTLPHSIKELLVEFLNSHFTELQYDRICETKTTEDWVFFDASEEDGEERTIEVTFSKQRR